jgi:SsrA-binding protein
MVKEVGRKLIAQNKKARHDYSIEDVYECGLVLTGTEVKSLRLGRASLIDGFAMVQNGELWLSGVHIPEYTEGTWTNHPPRRDRKLLVHRDELDRLTAKMKEGGLTLIPLTLYFKDESRTTSVRPCWSVKWAGKPSVKFLDVARESRAIASSTGIPSQYQYKSPTLNETNYAIGQSSSTMRTREQSRIHQKKLHSDEVTLQSPILGVNGLDFGC